MNARWALGLVVAALACSSALLAPARAQEREVLGERSAIDLGQLERPSRELAAGTRLRKEPAETSDLVVSLPLTSEVLVLEEREGWLRVQWQGRRGWVHLEAPLAGDGAEAILAEPDPAAAIARALEERTERLMRAQSVMTGARTLQSGRYRVLTDLAQADARWRSVSNLLRCFPDFAAQRWQVGPAEAAAAEAADAGDTGDIVVLFEHEETYQRYVALEEQLVGVETGGHAFPGYAALHFEGAVGDGGLGLLAHELAHLESSRRFGQSLPAWLEEGLAEELAWSVAAAGDCSMPGAFPEPRRTARASAPRQVDVTVTWPSETVDLACALLAWGSNRPPLERLFALGHEQLRMHPQRTSLYVAAALTVRVWAAQAPSETRTFGLSELLAAYAASPERGKELLATADAEMLAREAGRWLARQRAMRSNLPRCPR